MLSATVSSQHCFELLLAHARLLVEPAHPVSEVLLVELDQLPQ